MAQVRTTDGVPSVAPAGAPNTTQNISASPDDFGAQVGRAQEQGARQVENLGGAVGQAANAGFNIVDHFHQVQTDSALNGVLDAGFKTVGQYKTLNGQAALDAQADTQKSIDDIFTNGRKGLKTTAQVESYDQAAAHYKRTLMDDVASHGATAARQTATDTNKASAQLALQGVASYADNDDQFTHFWADARRAAVQQVMVENSNAPPPPGTVKAALANADMAVFKTRIEAVGAKNPQRASEMTEANKDRLGMYYDNMSNEMRTRAAEQRGLEVVNDSAIAVGAAMQQKPTIAARSAYTQATFDQESGDKGVNPGQITPDTWARWQKEGIVKPGQRYDNPVDTRDVAKRATEMYYDKYQDPARAAVAWFSGPGNVAPEGSAQPFIHDVADKNGKKVSSYVQDISGRVSGPTSTNLAVRANMMDAILDRTQNDPHARKVAILEFDRQARAAETASMSNQAAIQQQRQATMRAAGDAIAAGKTVNLRGAGSEHLTEEEVEHLEDLQKKALTARINGAPGDLGPGYADAHARILSTGPDRIVNQEQLLTMTRGPNAPLNAEGFKEAGKTLDEMNKPGAEADKALQENFFKSMRFSVTSDEGDGKYTNAEYLKNWNKALPVLQETIRQGREKGLTNAQLMNPDSKDYVGNAVKPFLPSASGKMAAEIDKDKKAVFDWQKIATHDDAKAAYEKHLISREEYRVLWNKNGWGKKPGAAPAVPAGQ